MHINISKKFVNVCLPLPESLNFFLFDVCVRVCVLTYRHLHLPSLKKKNSETKGNKLSIQCVYKALVFQYGKTAKYNYETNLIFLD